MKTFILLSLLTLGLWIDASAQEFKVITTVESIVPMGVGRSRIIENLSNADAGQATTARTDGVKSSQKNVKRSSLKVNELAETKLLNFYSIAGINFQNIASNDALVTSKINTLSAQGWELVFVTSGVESDAGKTDDTGIYITRYIFKRDSK